MPFLLAQHSRRALKPFRRGVWRFIPALIWMAVIFVLSSRTGGELNSWLPWFRRILPGLQSFDPMHYAAYFILAFTVAYAFGPRLACHWRGSLGIIAVCVLYGMTDEWHQAYVPNRTPDPLDLWHDTVGAAAACVILLLAGRFFALPRSNNYNSESGRKPRSDSE